MSDLVGNPEGRFTHNEAQLAQYRVRNSSNRAMPHECSVAPDRFILVFLSTVLFSMFGLLVCKLIADTVVNPLFISTGQSSFSWKEMIVIH